MTNQEFLRLSPASTRGTAQTMKLSTQEFTIELTRGGASAPADSAPAAAPRCRQLSGACAPEQPPPLLTRLWWARSTRRPPRTRPPFVLPGDRVSKGQTVCLIEAMKMMSEVPAPCDCVIESVCKSNGELVAFGEPLFRYRPC